MIDYLNITNYERTERELEEFILFCAAVAGKNARTTDRAFDELCDHLGYIPSNKLTRAKMMEGNGNTLFSLIKWSPGLFCPALLKSCGFGCYNGRYDTFKAIAGRGLDLKRCSIEALESIKGIGLKTSRFFILHSRPKVPVAVLDTHILRFLRDQGVKNVPESTPSSLAKYRALESLFLKLVPFGKSAAEFDLDIWKYYRAEGRQAE